MLNLHLYMLQRLSALIMIPFVLGHIAIMIYAIQGGLSAGEILSRTQGSLFWFLFYASFVLALSLHASIGMRVIIHETFGIKERPLSAITWFCGLLLLFMGGRAVWAVTIG